MIPKIIWQSWKTKDLDPLIQDRLHTMMAMNPDYKHFLLTDDEIDHFVHTEYADCPDILACYDRLNIIVAKVDFWRYLVLYKYGGVYLDMDSTINQSLDGLIRPDDEAIITREGHPGIFVQWALIFNAGHPILKSTIDLIVRNIQTNAFPNDIHKMTGPTAFTQGVNNYHMSLYGEALAHKNEYIEQPNQVDVSYDRGIHYRIYGVDYNEFFSFNYPESRLLYRNVTHWLQEQKMKPLLLPG